MLAIEIYNSPWEDQEGYSLVPNVEETRHEILKYPGGGGDEVS
jgi:hypothetical protein